MSNTKTFYGTGARQTWVVPSNIGGSTVHVELWGAAGGNNPNGTLGGKGGRVMGTLAVAPGDVLYLYVGVKGGNSSTHQGGKGGTYGYPAAGVGGAGNEGYPAGGGGGGTFIIKNSTDYNVSSAVAGGGGGCAMGALGGDGGGNTGQAGASGGAGGTGGGGGTQSAGGAGGNGAGSYGNGGAGSHMQGGNGAVGHAIGNAGGGGGRGWYGGGGGGTGVGGGGGGSNYTGGLTGTITNTQGYASATGSGKIIITYDLAPNAPSLTSPATNANLDYALAIPVTWHFSDPDSGDVQTAADVRWRVGTGAWTTITSAVSGTGSTYTFAANTFSAYPGQKVEWQVRTSDASGYGRWSASAYFNVYAAPTALFVIDPVPTTIDSQSVPMSGERDDDGPMSAWQVRAVNDLAGTPGSTVQVDSGTMALPGSPTSVSGAIPPHAYTNGTSYHLQARYAYPLGVWGAWADSGAVVANINAPLAPTLDLTPFSDTGSVQVQITNPGSDPYAPDHNVLYREDTTTGIETLVQNNLPLNGTWTDWGVGFNRTYRYRAEAVTATGAVTSSA